MSPEPEVLVRPACPGDGAALARIHLDAAAYYLDLAPEQFQQPAEDGLVAYLESELEPPDGALALVAEIGGEPAGAVFARIVPPLDDGRYQWGPAFTHTRLSIEYLATAESHQRRGIATALVEAAEQWGRDRGATVAFTETFLGSPVSRPFWRDRMGYGERSVSLYKDL